MPKRSAYANFTRSVEVPLVNGDTLHITYYPAKLAGSALQKDDTAFLESLIAGWDWTDEDEQPIPVTEEYLSTEVYVMDRAAMVKAILADMDPNASTPTSSN